MNAWAMSHSRTVVATLLAAMSGSATTLPRLLPCGQAALVLSPLELLDRLAALILRCGDIVSTSTGCSRRPRSSPRASAASIPML
jgi:hypothetical protein